MNQTKNRKLHLLLIFFVTIVCSCSNLRINGTYYLKGHFSKWNYLGDGYFKFIDSSKRFTYLYKSEGVNVRSSGIYQVIQRKIVLRSDTDPLSLPIIVDTSYELTNKSYFIYKLDSIINRCNTLKYKILAVDYSNDTMLFTMNCNSKSDTIVLDRLIHHFKVIAYENYNPSIMPRPYNLTYSSAQYNIHKRENVFNIFFKFDYLRLLNFMPLKDVSLIVKSRKKIYLEQDSTTYFR